MKKRVGTSMIQKTDLKMQTQLVKIKLFTFSEFNVTFYYRFIISKKN